MKHKQIDGIVVSTWLLLVAGVLLYAFSGYVWYQNIYLNQDRVFWSAIDGALTTSGVVKEIDYSTDQTTQTQKIMLNFTPTLSSEGGQVFKNQNGQETVSESIAFPKSDFARFASIVNPETPKLKALEGIWANTSGPEGSESKILADHLTNGALILVGNLPKTKRDKLVNMMRDTKMYEVIGVSGKKEYSGKTANVYTVRIKVDSYNTVLTSYFQMIGMPGFAEQVSQSSEDTTDPIIEIAINPSNRQIYEAGYPKVGQAGTEKYSLWGFARQPVAPEESVTATELQKRLDEAYTP